MRPLILTLLATFLFACEPHPLKAELEELYPNCQVLRVYEVDREHVEASLQCGPVVKTVTYRVY